MIPRMRNTLVLVDLIDKPERKLSNFIIPSNGEEYCEAEVLALGPGTISASGGMSETHDLKVGQRVWIKHKQKDPRSGVLVLAGIRYQSESAFYYIFEQSSVIAVLADKGTFPAAIPTAEIVQ